MMNERPQALRFGPVSAAAPGPLYEQVVAAVRREVANGGLKPGDALPSVRALAADLLVSVITIKRAYEELERGGLIYSRQGLGTFVADAGAEQARLQKIQAARQALGEAAAAAREAGLRAEDLIDMLNSEFRRGTDR